MISADMLPDALKALQRLIMHSKDQAYECGATELAQLLNDTELLPEYMADERDRTDELIEMLHGIAQVYPSCRHLVEEFERAPGAAR